MILDNNEEPKGEEPKIVYPLQWTYAVIGLSEIELRAALDEVLIKRTYEVELSNVSSKGKYISLRVTTLVQDEDDRNRIFKALNDHPVTKKVI